MEIANPTSREAREALAGYLASFTPIRPPRPDYYRALDREFGHFPRRGFDHFPDREPVRGRRLSRRAVAGIALFVVVTLVLNPTDPNSIALAVLLLAVIGVDFWLARRSKRLRSLPERQRAQAISEYHRCRSEGLIVRIPELLIEVFEAAVAKLKLEDVDNEHVFTANFADVVFLFDFVKIAQNDRLSKTNRNRALARIRRGMMDLARAIKHHRAAAAQHERALARALETGRKAAQGHQARLEATELRLANHNAKTRLDLESR